MKSQMLFNWLDRLSKKELEEFQIYIQLGSLDASRIEVELTKSAIEFKGERSLADSIDLIKMQTWPEKEVRESYWNKICSILLNRLREFLAWKSWREKNHSVPLGLARYANENHWDEEFMKIYKRGWKVFDSKLGQDSTYYRRKAEFLNEKAIYDYRISRRPDPIPIVNVIKELDSAYRLEKIKFAASVRNHEMVFRKSFDLGGMLTLLEAIEEQYEDLPIVGKLYFHAFQSMSDDKGSSHYIKLKSLIYENPKDISPDDTWDLNTYLINYCARQIRNGKKGYEQELKSLFDLMLDQGVFLEKGKISPWLYKNIVVTTLRSGLLEWAKDFSKKYKLALHNDYNNNAVNFCQSAVAFSDKNFLGSRSLLTNVLQDYKDQFYGVEARLLHWRCNVELREVMDLTYQSDAYIKFFHRHPLLEETYKASVICFLRLSLRFVVALDLSQKELKKVLRKILSRIEKEEPMDLLKWLEKKIMDALQ